MKLIQLHDGTVVNPKRIRFARITNGHGVKRLLIVGKGNETSLDVSGTEEEMQADLRLLSGQEKVDDFRLPMLVYMNREDQVRIVTNLNISEEDFYKLSILPEGPFVSGEYIGVANSTMQLIQLINNFN